MAQTISVTEARDNFPSLVRQVAEQDDPVIVTSRNQPRVVLLRWETYQQQQALQVEGAAHRLQTQVAAMLALIAILQEVYQPGSYTLIQGIQELATLARQAWLTCRLLDRPYLHLASTLADGLQFVAKAQSAVTLAQLQVLAEQLPLLLKEDLTLHDVTASDQILAEVGLDAMPVIEDDLAALYGQGEP